MDAVETVHLERLQKKLPQFVHGIGSNALAIVLSLNRQMKLREVHLVIVSEKLSPIVVEHLRSGNGKYIDSP